MRAAIAIATFLGLTAPASALCVTGSDGDEGYPRGKEALLLLCQQNELSDAVEDRAAAEQLRAMRARLQALELQQRLLPVRPISPFSPYEILRF